MNGHKNARRTWRGRRLLVWKIDEIGLSAAASAAGVSLRPARACLARFESGHLHPQVCKILVTCIGIGAGHPASLQVRTMASLVSK